MNLYKSTYQTFGVILSLFCWQLCCFTAHGQQYFYQNYSVKEGLPQSEVWFRSFKTDRDGRLWIGTNGGGIVQMQGAQMDFLTTKDGLKSNQIRGIDFDKNGNMWACTGLGGLFKYDGKTIRYFDDAQNSLANANFVGLSLTIHDKYDNLWALIFSAGGIRTLYKITGDSLLVDAQELYPELKDSNYNFITEDSEGQLWLTRNGADPLVFDGKKFVKPSVDFPAWFNGRWLAFGRLDNQGNTWFLLADPNAPGGGELIRYKEGVFEQVKLPPPYHKSQFLTDVMEDSKGNLWFAFVTLGILKYDGSQYHLYETGNGLANSGVNDLLEDYEGNIWAGIRGGGISLLPSTSFETFTVKDGLPGGVVFSVYEDSKGAMWFGTATNGFAKYENGQMHTYSAKEYGQMLRVDAFWEEPDGNMLIGTRGSGLFRFDGKNLKPVSIEFGLPANAGVNHFLEHQGKLVMATSGGGLAFYDMENKKPIKTLTTANGTPNNFIADVRADSKGNYWIISNTTLSYCNMDTCIAVPPTDGKPLGILLQLHIDIEDRIWIASYDQGLIRYHNGEFTRFEILEENPLGILYSVTADNDGNLWLGTQNGINKATIDELGNVSEVTNHGVADGLPEVEMNGQAAFTDSKGSVWMGHLSGASRYRAGEKVYNDTPPVTLITDVQLFAQPTDWLSDELQQTNQGIEKWNKLPIDLELDYDQNYLSFHFASLSYRAPNKIRRQWMIDGVDSDWLPPSERTEATYSGLPYGKHTFRVRTMNSDGVWGPASTFTFHITPPIWETWWFRLTLVLIVASVVYLLVRARINAIKEKKEELEKLVNERTAELQQKNEEVTQQNNMLEQQKEEILTKNEEIETQNLALGTAYDEIKEQNTNITSSITYAKRIQEAMLPRRETVQKIFPQSFILYRPRDIVSGDFYWLHQAENEGEPHIFAVADCTGHGVPGAFMSMAGDAYLNLAVKNKRLFDPGEILHSLDKDITASLKQGISENRDGMDISICAWYPDSKKLVYAGARNPLIYIQDGKLKQIKGTKRAIGDTLIGNKHSFLSHEIIIDQPTCIYQFSDGYVDQFGGAANKKFLIKQFRELLLDIYFLPMEKQKEVLEKQLNDWIGDYRQIDDILVAGFHLP